MRNRRTNLERSRDLEAAAARSLRGETCEEIARALGVSSSQISRDLKRKEQEWMKEAMRDFGLLRARELAKLRGLQYAHFQAWEASKAPREKCCTLGAQGRTGYVTTITLRTEPAEAAPKYLAGVLRCIRQRRRMLQLSGKALERYLSEREENERLEEEMKLAEAATEISLLRQVERVYGSIQAWLGLRCPETPGVWWGAFRIFGPEDWARAMESMPGSKGPRR